MVLFFFCLSTKVAGGHSLSIRGKSPAPGPRLLMTTLYSHANKTRFHKKVFGLSLVLKVRIFGIRKWPIRHLHISHNAPYLPPFPPPQILHNLCFSFPLGITAVLREIENNA